MTKYRNPNAWRLTWRSMSGWRQVTLFDIDQGLKMYPPDHLPETFIGKVRWVIKLSGIDGTVIRLNRYFDTVDYQNEVKLEALGGVRVHTGSCV